MKIDNHRKQRNFSATPNHNMQKSLGEALFKGDLRWLPVALTPNQTGNQTPNH